MKIKKSLIVATVIGLSLIGCNSQEDKPIIFASSAGGGGNNVPPVTPASWLIPNWYFNPSTGNDSNSCTASGNPCKTFAQIASRWGTYEPTFPQTTNIFQQASQTDSTDPIIIRVRTRGASATFSYTGTPIAVGTGTISSPTAKTYGTGGSGTPLIIPCTNASPTLVQGNLITNTTRANSTAFVAFASGGNCFIDQPMSAPTNPPGFGTYRTENNAWTSGDSITSATLPNANIVDWSPSPNNAAFGISVPMLQTITIASLDVAGSFMTINGYSTWQDVLTLRPIVQTNAQDGFSFTHDSVEFGAGIGVSGPSVGNYVQIAAGDIRTATSCSLNSVNLGTDIIINSNFVSIGGVSKTGFAGTATGDGIYIGTGDTVNFLGYNVLRCSGACVMPYYGPGILNIGGSVSLNFAGPAVNVFLTTSMKMNGGTTACAQSNVTPSVTNCGITLNPANLDAAFGVAGFGDVAKSFATGAIIQNLVNN